MKIAKPGSSECQIFPLTKNQASLLIGIVENGDDIFQFVPATYTMNYSLLGQRNSYAKAGECANHSEANTACGKC